MSNKVLSLKKESSMRKMSILCVIAIFLVFCSISVFAEEQKTKVDPDKFKNLTESQKKEVVEKSKEARDTALESKKIHDEVAETAEKVVKVLEVAKDVGEVAQKALSQKEQNLWKDPVLEKLKAEEKAKKDKEKK
jgi:hypothetical protein